ncbi:hypothetical protein N0V88_001559 [Collariella sp. IMI 366227]|nr:hypothetical protein N0V88_001559 [Collariella sp. IMI 366227]
MPTKCYITGLPLNILSQICKKIVKGGEDTTTLARLARTCRILGEVTAKRLYSHLVDRAHHPYYLTPPINHSIRLNLPALQHTLFSNREVAKVVRTIHLVGNRSSTEHRQYEFQYSPVATRPPLVNLYRNMAIQELFGLDPSMPNSFQDPINMLALAFLSPNLEHLDLYASSAWRSTDFLLRRVNGRLAGARRTLDNLKVLIIRHYRAQGQSYVFRPQSGINLQHLNGLLYGTPRITNLEVQCARGGTSLTCRLPFLTKLVLTDAHLCARGLRLLLRGCTRLVTFVFTQEKVARLSPRFLPVSPGQILAGLAPSGNTLRNLHIAPWILDDNDPRTGPYTLLERFGRFPGLRQLLVCLDALEGLLLTGVSAPFEQAFVPFVRCVMDLNCPHLKTVMVQTLRMDKDRMWGRVEDAQAWEAQVADKLENDMLGQGDIAIRTLSENSAIAKL